MTIRANHLTVARMVLLPLPVWLLYQGTWGRMWALALLALLGLTDYLDGLLARRQGATALGRLLDPIADKIFVAAMVIPLVDLQILPLWMGWLLLFREFLVTELRREMSRVGLGLPVVELAKIKTTLQMTGLGLMVMTATFPGREVTTAFLSGALVSTAILAITIYIRFGEFTFRMRAALGLMAAGLLTALLLPARQVNLVYGGVIVAVTLFTGAGYALRGLPVVAARGGWALLELTARLTAPLLPLALFHHLPGWAAPLLLVIISQELAVQGLETWEAPPPEGPPLSPTALVKGGATAAAFGVALGRPTLLSPAAALVGVGLVDLAAASWTVAGFLRRRRRGATG